MENPKNLQQKLFKKFWKAVEPHFTAYMAAVSIKSTDIEKLEACMDYLKKTDEFYKEYQRALKEIGFDLFRKDE